MTDPCWLLTCCHYWDPKSWQLKMLQSITITKQSHKKYIKNNQLSQWYFFLDTQNPHQKFCFHMNLKVQFTLYETLWLIELALMSFHFYKLYQYPPKFSCSFSQYPKYFLFFPPPSLFFPLLLKQSFFQLKYGKWRKQRFQKARG